MMKKFGQKYMPKIKEREERMQLRRLIEMTAECFSVICLTLETRMNSSCLERRACDMPRGLKRGLTFDRVKSQLSEFSLALAFLTKLRHLIVWK